MFRLGWEQEQTARQPSRNSYVLHNHTFPVCRRFSIIWDEAHLAPETFYKHSQNSASCRCLISVTSLSLLGLNLLDARHPKEVSSARNPFLTPSPIPSYNIGLAQTQQRQTVDAQKTHEERMPEEAVPATDNQPKPLKSTLNLPQTTFPMKAGLPVNEPLRLKTWEQQDLYAQIRAARAGAEKYILHDGPPYA